MGKTCRYYYVPRGRFEKGEEESAVGVSYFSAAQGTRLFLFS